MSAFWNLLFVAFLFFLTRWQSRPIPGLDRWTLGQLFFFLSTISFATRGTLLPQLPSILFGNGFLLAALASLYTGTTRFFAQPTPRWPWLLLVIDLTVIAFFAAIQPDYRWRVLTISLTAALIQIAHWRVVWQNDRTSIVAKLLLLSLSLSALAFTLRALATPWDAPDTPLFSSQPHQNLYLFAQSFLNMFLGLSLALFAIQKVLTDLERLSFQDPLTGAFNRRAFAAEAVRQIAMQERSGEPISFLVLDIDYFKSINDRYGHATGDRVLRDLVARTNQQLRSSDTLSRHGGEEFIVILPATTPEEALAIAERIRLAIEAPSSNLPPYTVSIGVATLYQDPAQAGINRTLTPSSDQTTKRTARFESAIQRADEALYRAKREGRNRVISDLSPPSEPSDDPSSSPPLTPR
ncbi:MAG: GGDEF domain-containing protein [Hydrogenophilus sp.]|nr:GGDEF domain-containing protein [Hydrogenophilus sp.]